MTHLPTRGAFGAALLALAVLTACQPTSPTITYTAGDTLASYDFSENTVFETGSFDGAALRIRDGVYVIDLARGDNALWWGQAGDDLTDTVIAVETEQQSEREENAYGVICRAQGSVGQESVIDPALAALMAEATPEATAESTPDAEATPEAEATAEVTPEATEAIDPDAEAIGAEPTAEATPDATPEATDNGLRPGDGYYFLIQGTGQYGIFRARGRDLFPLVNWTASDAINRGRARNTLQAICAGNNLIFTINGRFVAQTTDSTYASGQVGLTASSATRIGARIAFDNLLVSSAVQGG